MARLPLYKIRIIRKAANMIHDALYDRGIKKKHFAERAGIPPIKLSQILGGARTSLEIATNITEEIVRITNKELDVWDLFVKVEKWEMNDHIM